MKGFLSAILALMLLAGVVAGVMYLSRSPAVQRTPEVSLNLPKPSRQQWAFLMDLQKRHLAVISAEQKLIFVEGDYWASLGRSGQEELATNLLVAAVSMDPRQLCYNVADMKTHRLLATWRFTGYFPRMVLPEEGL